MRSVNILDKITAESVKVIDQITNVKIGLPQTTGICVICGDEGEVVRVIANIYYPTRDQHGRVCIVESLWSQDFCSFCINQFFGSKEEELKGYI